LLPCSVSVRFSRTYGPAGRARSARAAPRPMRSWLTSVTILVSWISLFASAFYIPQIALGVGNEAGIRRVKRALRAEFRRPRFVISSWPKRSPVRWRKQATEPRCFQTVSRLLFRSHHAALTADPIGDETRGGLAAWQLQAPATSQCHIWTRSFDRRDRA